MYASCTSTSTYTVQKKNQGLDWNGRPAKAKKAGRPGKAGRQLSDFQIKILRGDEVYLKYKYNMYNCIHNVPIKTF